MTQSHSENGEPRLDGGPDTEFHEPAHDPHCYGCANEKQELCEEITRLRAENERLRETLRLIGTFPYPYRDPDGKCVYAETVRFFANGVISGVEHE